MSQRRPNVWELVVNLGREVRPALRSIPARAGSRNDYWAKHKRYQ